MEAVLPPVHGCLCLLLLAATPFSSEPAQPGGPPATDNRSRITEPEHPDRDANSEDAKSVLERFKVTTDGGLLLLPVVLEGKRYPFVLDTGATHGVYDQSFRALLGEPLRSERVWTPGQDITVPIFRSPAGKMGAFPLPVDSLAFCSDLNKLREISSQDIHGIVGMDFLRQHIFRVDFDRGEVTFLRSVGPHAGQRVPVHFQGNFPFVTVEVQGLHGEAHFLVDTGFAGFGSGGLKREIFTTLTMRGELVSKGQTNAETFSGESKHRLGRVAGMALSGYRHEHLLLSESKGNVLNLNYWSRYVVTFDFPHGAMYLKKGRRFDQPDVRDLSGLHILRRQGQTLVDSVEEGSVSAKAGFKPQDVLLSIDERDLSELSLSRVRGLLCDREQERRVVLQRGEMKQKVVLHLNEE